MKKLSSLLLLSCLLICHIAKAQSPDLTEEQWKSFFTSRIHQLDRLEGIWSVSVAYKATIYGQQPITGKELNFIRYAIFKKDNSTYTICHIKGSNVLINGNAVKSNVIKCTLEKTASEDQFLFEQIDHIQKKDGSWVDYDVTANAVLKSNSILEYAFDYTNAVNNDIKTKQIFENFTMAERLLKIMPEIQNDNEISKQGSGFAISSNGYIATNNHVISGATSISVRGINGDFSKSYNANVIVVDKKNDLAIIQIADFSKSTNFRHIPYIISNKTSDVGSSIFVLGYPKDAIMGDEIKLTNGIISSKTGIQGDVTTYQISAPIQPGNSGGPMFDDKANVLGITNAYLPGTENVNYAIKTSYLLDLIETLPSSAKLQNVNALSNKALTEQVKTLRNFIYIIEVK